MLAIHIKAYYSKKQNLEESMELQILSFTSQDVRRLRV